MDTDDIDRETRERKAAQARKKLIAAIVACFVIAVVAVVLIVVFLVPLNSKNSTSHAASSSSASTEIQTSQVKDQALVGTVAATTTVPNMAALFGQTLDAVTTTIPGAVQVSLAATTDENLPAATQLADYGIYQTAADGSQTKLADLYLYLDASNAIIGSYYVVPLKNLGYTSNTTNFAGLLGDSTFIATLLSAAGTGVTGYVPTVPDASAYETTTTNAAGASVVSKDEYTYSGNTALAVAPLTWAIKFTYDYGTSNITGNIADASYTVAVTLS